MNAVFIHIPKTAGRYIIKTLSLQRLIYRHRAINDFQQSGMVTFGHLDYRGLIENGIIEKAFDKTAFKFTFCRNPFDRTVSHYFWVRWRHPGILPRHIGFVEFAGNIEKYNILKHHSNAKAFRPQCHSIENIDINFVGRLERLNEDIEKIANFLGIKARTGQKIGATKHRPYQTYYTQEAEENIRQFYREDFERFGYDDYILYGKQAR